MSLREWFSGPPHQPAWREVAKELAGVFKEGGFWKSDQLTFVYRDREVVLEVASDGEDAFTSAKTTFLNPQSFTFQIENADFFTPLLELFRRRAILSGDPAFDNAFVFRSNQPGRFRRLIDDPELKTLLMSQMHASLQASDPKRFFTRVHPAGRSELKVSRAGVVTESQELLRLIALMKRSLALLEE